MFGDLPKQTGVRCTPYETAKDCRMTPSVGLGTTTDTWVYTGRLLAFDEAVVLGV